MLFIPGEKALSTAGFQQSREPIRQCKTVEGALLTAWSARAFHGRQRPYISHVFDPASITLGSPRLGRRHLADWRGGLAGTMVIAPSSTTVTAGDLLRPLSTTLVVVRRISRRHDWIEESTGSQWYRPAFEMRSTRSVRSIQKRAPRSDGYVHRGPVGIVTDERSEKISAQVKISRFAEMTSVG